MQDANDDVEFITPQLAARYLETACDNRPTTTRNVERLAVQIQRNEWITTHQGIAFDAENHLVDGRHRMLAVIKSGIGISVKVTRGVPHEAFRVMDTGRPRSGGDILSMGSGIKISTTVAAALRLIWCHENIRTAGHWHGQALTPLTNNVLVGLLEGHPDVVEWGLVANRLRKQVPATPRATAAALTLIAEAVGDDEMVKSFVEGMMTGAGLLEGDVRLRTRSYFINKALSKIKTAPREEMAVLIKSWNYWIDGASPGVMKFAGNESFPTIQT